MSTVLRLVKDYDVPGFLDAAVQVASILCSICMPDIHHTVTVDHRPTITAEVALADRSPSLPSKEPDGLHLAGYSNIFPMDVI